MDASGSGSGFPRRESLPRKRIAVGGLFIDGSYRVLIVKPTYKDGWDLPGGIVEEGESPFEAFRREIGEELGLRRGPRRLLCLDWTPSQQGPMDGLVLLFEGGVLSEEEIKSIRLPRDELAAFKLVPDAVIEEFLPAFRARRLAAGIRARDLGVTVCLENGHPAS